MKRIVLRYKIACYFLSLEKKLNRRKKGPIYYINHIYSFVHQIKAKANVPLQGTRCVLNVIMLPEYSTALILNVQVPLRP